MEKKNEKEILSPTSKLHQTFSKGENTYSTEKSVKYPKPLGDMVDEWKTREKSWRRLKDNKSDERERKNTK